jgi:hypothetical protein
VIAVLVQKRQAIKKFSGTEMERYDEGGPAHSQNLGSLDSRVRYLRHFRNRVGHLGFRG